MADDDDDGDELDAIWNPAKGNTSALAKKPLALVVADGKQSYVALETKDKVLAFVVRSSSNGFRYSFAYHTLSTTAMHDPNADFLSLVSDRGVIDLYGKNLLPIAMAVEMHTCYSITEFSPAQHLPPTDKSAPFIERIEVTLPRPPEKRERGTKKEETAEGQEA